MVRYKQNQKKSQLPSGQALLMLLVFSAIAMTIIGATVAISILNARASSMVATSEIAFRAAQSGINEAVLRLLRDPNFTTDSPSSPIAMPVGSGTVIISVTGPITSKTITAVGSYYSHKRTIQATGGYDVQNRFTLSNWTEIP